jgi:hypothetical protein
MLINIAEKRGCGDISKHGCPSMSNAGGSRTRVIPIDGFPIQEEHLRFEDENTSRFEETFDF